MAHVIILAWVIVTVVVVEVSGNMNNNNNSEMVTSKETFTTNMSWRFLVFRETHSNFINQEQDNNETSGNYTEDPWSTEIPVTIRPSILTIINSGSISKEMFYALLAVHKYLQFILIGLGIVFNVLNISVFNHKRMRNPTTRILIFLTSSELCLAVMNCLMACMKVVLGRDAIKEWIFLIMIRFLRMYINAALRQCSFCFNMLVALERSIAIAFPLKSKYFWFCRKPTRFCLIFLAVNFIYEIYNPLKMNVVEICIENSTSYLLQDTKLFSENRDLFAAFNMVGKISFTYIPLCGSLILNVFMLVALRRHKQKRIALHVCHQQTNNYELQTTFTILVSSFLFVVLAIPLTIPSIIASMNTDFAMYKKEHYLYYFLALIFGMCASLSLSVNFCVYMVLSSEFRTTFRLIAKSVICCPSCTQNNGIRIQNPASSTSELGSLSGSRFGNANETQVSFITCSVQEVTL